MGKTHIALLAATGVAFALAVQGCAGAKPGSQSAAPAPAAASGPSATASGKQLFESKCVGCHQTEVFKAPKRKAIHFADLRNKVFACSEAAKTGWDITQNMQVFNYVNSEFYGFK